MDLTALQKQLSHDHGKLPPVEKWNPDFCGDIDMQIRHDGSWFYMGTPIGRKALVKLFASVLKKEGDDYFLVTPVEKIGIQVEDVPFIINTCEMQDDHLVFTSNCEDKLVVGEEHPVVLQQDKVTGDLLPYVNVRRNLWARLSRNVFYQLAEEGEEVQEQGKSMLRISSGDYHFPLGEC